MVEIVNKSKWADEDIGLLVGRIMDRTGARGMVGSITVKTGKGANKKEDKQFSGYCYPNRKDITVMVPNTSFRSTRLGSDGSKMEVKDWTVFNSEWFAKVLTHEIHHLSGIDHSDMIDWWELDCSYAKVLEVRSKRMKKFHDAFGSKFDARF